MSNKTHKPNSAKSVDAKVLKNKKNDEKKKEEDKAKKEKEE